MYPQPPKPRVAGSNPAAPTQNTKQFDGRSAPRRLRPKAPPGTYRFTRETYYRFWDFVDLSAGEDACWPFLGVRNMAGYGQVIFEGETIPASRMACIMAHGDHPGTRTHARRFALHSCDNPPCVNPRHLRWGSGSDNAQDCLKRGRWRGGRPKRLKPTPGHNARTCEVGS